MPFTARTTQTDGIETVQLADSTREIQVGIAPSVGNMAYSWTVKGQNFLYFPYNSVADFARQPRLCAVPFLGPWANRVDGDGFWANGKRYLFNDGLGNLRRDGNKKPIHGLLNFSKYWKLAEAKSDANSAWSTSKLEFWRYPDLMAQFPFPHTVAMTYRLRDGELEVETAIENQGTDPMPVAVGYHPYFRLHGAPRDQWHVHIAARDHMNLNPQLIPTGESRPVEYEDPQALAGIQFDDVFGGLVRDASGKARFWVEGGRERITVSYGAAYTTAVIYAPRGQDFICFEPMSAITNGFNLAHDGVYKDLQSVAPGQTWKGSFWLQAEIR